jgi:hypothetical protein
MNYGLKVYPVNKNKESNDTDSWIICDII